MNNGQVIILLIYGGFLDLLGRRPANLSICRSAHFRVQTKLARFQNLLQTENHILDFDIAALN